MKLFLKVSFSLLGPLSALLMAATLWNAHSHHQAILTHTHSHHEGLNKAVELTLLGDVFAAAIASVALATAWAIVKPMLKRKKQNQQQNTRPWPSYSGRK